MAAAATVTQQHHTPKIAVDLSSVLTAPAIGVRRLAEVATVLPLQPNATASVNAEVPAAQNSIPPQRSTLTHLSLQSEQKFFDRAEGKSNGPQQAAVGEWSSAVTLSPLPTTKTLSTDLIWQSVADSEESSLRFTEHETLASDLAIEWTTRQDE